MTTSSAMPIPSNANKKRQFEDDNKITTTKPLNPFHAAKQQLDVVLLLLPLKIWTFTSKNVLAATSDSHKCSQKKATILNLKDEEVVLNSTKTKFELQTSKLIKDLPQTTKLLTEVEELKQKFAKELKGKIVDSLQLEREAFCNNAITHLM